MRDHRDRHPQTRIQPRAFPAALLLALTLFGLIPAGRAMEADWPSMLLFHVNEVRRQHGAGAVTWARQLADAAAAHAQDLQGCGSLSHTGCNGSELRQRLERAGYGFRMAAENLALCACDAAEVVRLWMQSEGHRRNLLNAEAREIGGATLQDRDGRDVWVLVLGAQR